MNFAEDVGHAAATSWLHFIGNLGQDVDPGSDVDQMWIKIRIF